MRNYKKCILILGLLFLLYGCNKKNESNIIEYGNIEATNFTEIINIYVSGYYGWNTVNYIYEIKKIESKYILSIIQKGELIKGEIIYEQVLSDEKINNIYNYIVENEIELEINKATGWQGSHDFYGSIIININSKIYENEINSTQEFNNNLYKILNYLNDIIEDKTKFMPIYGVEEGRGRYNRIN
jgi:hypothetical protein